MVSHIFYGATKEEAAKQYRTHSRIDPFLRDVDKFGRFGRLPFRHKVRIVLREAVTAGASEAAPTPKEPQEAKEPAGKAG